MMLALVNIWMLLTALGSVFLLNSSPRWHRWGSVVGLAGQPAWLYLTHVTGESGMFTASVFFTVCYGQGGWRGFCSGVRRG